MILRPPCNGFVQEPVLTSSFFYYTKDHGKIQENYTEKAGQQRLLFYTVIASVIRRGRG